MSLFSRKRAFMIYFYRKKYQIEGEPFKVHEVKLVIKHAIKYKNQTYYFRDNSWRDEDGRLVSGDIRKSLINIVIRNYFKENPVRVRDNIDFTITDGNEVDMIKEAERKTREVRKKEYENERNIDTIPGDTVIPRRGSGIKFSSPEKYFDWNDGTLKRYSPTLGSCSIH